MDDGEDVNLVLYEVYVVCLLAWAMGQMLCLT